MALVSPAGTRSVVIAPFANQTAGFTNPWTFTSVQFWGESGVGTWRLEVTDTETGTTGSVSSWVLRVYGTAEGAAEIPIVRETPLLVDRVPYRLDPGTLVASGEAPELLTAVALDGGTTWQDAAGAWWFEPMGDDHGEFPVGVTVRTGNGEARHGVVRLRRPLLRTDGAAADLLPGIVAAAFASAPRQGRVESVGDVFGYTPAETSAAYRGLDRFELEDAGGDRLSVPILYADRWAFAANGRDSIVRLDFGNRSLDERLTVEGWIRPDGWGEAATGFGRFFDKETISIFINGFDHAFYHEASFVVFTEYADGSVGAFNTAPNTAVLGAWQHLAVTFDANRSPQVELFLDGLRLPLTSPEDLFPPGPGRSLLSNAATNGSIGDNAGGLRGFRGLFHDLRVWSSVRGEAAIAAAARAEEPAADESLLMRLNPSEPNFATGPLPGSGAVVASVEAGQWQPIGSPWAGLREAFPGIAPEFGATWTHPAWGRLGGDFFPWVYASGWGWIYAFAEEGASEWFYPAAGDFGWVFAKDGVYPWIYVHARGEWLYHAVGTAFFFSPAEGAWIGPE